VPPGPTRKIPFIWLFWLVCFSLCFAALYYPPNEAGEESKSEAALRDHESGAEPAARLPSSSGAFQVNSSLPECAPPRSYSLQGPRGLLAEPDINAAVPTLNNRGQVVVEEQEKADGLAAFTVPPGPLPDQLADVPRIIAPLKITPDAEAVKQKIAAKQQELCDDAAFRAEVDKLEAAMKTGNFSQHANQMPDNGLGSLIKKYARLHGVDARLVWAVMRQESGFNPQAVSPKGAMGLMQLIPGTAALMGVSDPFDIEQNISGGVRFLKLCLTKFNHNVVWALAAYNAGPDNVSKYQGCPPFAETRNYVLKVMRDYTGKTIALPFPVLAAAKGRPDGKNSPAAKPSEPAETVRESGLDWKVPQAKFKVAGPTWKLPLGPTIVAGKIPDAIRQNPEVIRLLAKQNARKLLPDAK
jgi:Transglycosylase SLT domain